MAKLTDMLENGITELYASDKYAQFISNMSKFNNYSCRNALLILLQCPVASKVAGYTTWTQLGRQVKRGEKGIQILAPCNFRSALEREKIDPLSGQTIYGPDGKPIMETLETRPNRFKIAHVFDLSQTEGKEIPPNDIPALSGDVENFAGIYDRLCAISPLPVEQGDIEKKDAYGYASLAENRIVIRPGMSQVQTIGVLVHEIAHAKVHRPGDILEDRYPRKKRQEEIEAESIA